MVAGALGEVGRTVSAALTDVGHNVLPVSTRAPLSLDSAVLSVDAAAEMVESVGLVVNCGGRGDRRPDERTGLQSTAVLAPAAAAAGVPSVLISTTRVLEGYDEEPPEWAQPRPLTPYARANAENEAQWLDLGGHCVLRITNYFAAPSAATSPQSLLLPWSLVTEALASGRIGIRSGAELRKEFVSAKDVAAAAMLLAGAADAPPVVATAPGLSVSLRELAGTVAQAVEMTGRPCPEASFGPQGPQPHGCPPGWLAQHGWHTRLSLEEMTAVVADWIQRESGDARPDA